MTIISPDSIDLKIIFKALNGHKWKIVMSAAAGSLLVLIYLLCAVPEYQTSAIIQVESQHPSMLKNLGFNFTTSAPINAQAALIRTRYILEPVVLENTLNVIVKPSASYYGMGTIIVKKFDVPAEYMDKHFTLMINDNNSYRLLDEKNQVVSHDQFDLIVNTQNAQPGARFDLTIKPPMKIVENIAKHLRTISLTGDDSFQSTGILQLELTGTNAKEIRDTLNAIVKHAVQKNTQQKLKETRRTIDFLNKQLPEVKVYLEKAENALNSYHSNSGTLNMGIVNRLLVRKLANIEQAIQKIKTQKGELLQIYTHQHPLVKAMSRKEEILQHKLMNIRKEIKQFPSANQEEINLMREAKIKNAMYIALLKNQQQTEIELAGITPAITALTDATPPMLAPTSPVLMLLCGAFFGAFISTLIIMLVFRYDLVQ